MKMSRPAQKVENDIDFPVLGCSGELIRYNLTILSTTLEGSVAPPACLALLLHRSQLPSLASASPIKDLAPVLGVQLKVEGQVMERQKGPGGHSSWL